eukprot:349894-Chlamydomonas_euryale.AAC.16
MPRWDAHASLSDALSSSRKRPNCIITIENAVGRRFPMSLPAIDGGGAIVAQCCLVAWLTEDLYLP